jgi:hypothetical protein
VGTGFVAVGAASMVRLLSSGEVDITVGREIVYGILDGTADCSENE